MYFLFFFAAFRSLCILSAAALRKKRDAFAHYAWECDKKRQRGHYPRRYVRDAFAQKNAERPEKMRQHKAQRDKQYHFSQAGEEHGYFRLTERDERILQRHLRKEHYRSHHKERRVFDDEFGHFRARAEHDGVYLRSEQRQQPHARTVYQRGDRYDLHGTLHPVRVARAVIVADKRLNARSQPVQRHGHHLQRAHHHRQGSRMVAAAAGREFEVHVEHYLHRAFRRRHYERRQTEREHGQHYFRARAHIRRAEAKRRAFAEEKRQRPDGARRLRNDRRYRRSAHAQSERIYKQRIERNVERRAEQHGEHRSHAPALRGDKRVQPYDEYDENAAETVREQIFRSIGKAIARRAERDEKRVARRQYEHRQQRAERRQHNKRVAEYLVRFLPLSLSHTHIGDGRAAQSDEIAESRNDQGHGEHHTERGESVRSLLARQRADVYPVDEVVQQIYQLRGDRGKRELRDELRQRTAAEVGRATLFIARIQGINYCFHSFIQQILLP